MGFSRQEVLEWGATAFSRIKEQEAINVNNRGPNFPGELCEGNAINICHRASPYCLYRFYCLLFHVGVTTLLCSKVGPSHKVSSTLEGGNNKSNGMSTSLNLTNKQIKKGKELFHLVTASLFLLPSSPEAMSCESSYRQQVNE